MIQGPKIETTVSVVWKTCCCDEYGRGISTVSGSRCSLIRSASPRWNATWKSVMQGGRHTSTLSSGPELTGPKTNIHLRFTVEKTKKTWSQDQGWYRIEGWGGGTNEPRMRTNTTLIVCHTSTENIISFLPVTVFAWMLPFLKWLLMHVCWKTQ